MKYFYIFMASQIAHIIYSNCFFRKLDQSEIDGLVMPEEKINREEFILGSVFPDIRLIDENIRRADTHMFFSQIDLDFSGLNSFEAGWKFHLYCDMKREEILNKYDFYSLDDTSSMAGRPAKFMEDGLIYDSYDNWEKMYHYFNRAPYIRTKIKVNNESYMLWYSIIANYIKEKPKNKSFQIVISKLPPLAKKVDEIMREIYKIRKNKKAIEILLKIKEEIV